MSPPPNKVRVLFLSSCVNGGGAGRSLQAYLEHADDRIEPYVVMPEPGVIGDRLRNVKKIFYVPEFVERFQRSPYAWVERFGGFWLHLAANCYAVPRSMFKITKIARDLQPDLIYCNHMLANPVGALVGWRTNIPVVFHARNIHVAWIGRKFYRFLAGLKIVRRIICNSLASALIYHEYTEEKVRLVYNFVDLKQFDRSLIQPQLRKEFGIAENALVIGYVGRILPKKGIPVLLHAFRIVAETHPQAVLVLLGDNDSGEHKNLREEYTQLAQSLGIGDKTFFVGFREDIRPYMADFDILTLPSVEPESFGRVLIESMALGIPSVVAAHGGAVEVVKNGLNGLWSKPGDAEDLATHLDTLLSHPALRKQMGMYGASRVHKEFSGHDLANKITAILLDTPGRVVAYPAKKRFRRREKATHLK